jgi:trk system potassium uptake protein TrkA
VAYLTRFGVAMLPTASTVVQDSDQVFVLVTDEIAKSVADVAGAPPDGGH